MTSATKIRKIGTAALDKIGTAKDCRELTNVNKRKRMAEDAARIARAAYQRMHPETVLPPSGGSIAWESDAADAAPRFVAYFRAFLRKEAGLMAPAAKPKRKNATRKGAKGAKRTVRIVRKNAKRKSAKRSK